MFAFDQIAGNEQIIRNLQNAVEHKRVSHAYIFFGQKGIGKKMLANAFAKTLQCEEAGITPCCRCVSCAAYESGNHPDVFFVSALKTKSLGVDDVREQITKKLEIKPFRYPYKIFIVEHADTMTIQAQNAILKTIEEPPSYGIFILLAENTAAFLPTILSRCVLLPFRPLQTGVVEACLRDRHGLPAEKAALFAMFSMGNIGQALTLARDEEFIQMRENIIRVIRENDHPDRFSIRHAYIIAGELEKYKDRIQDALDILFLWYRDILTAKTHSAKRFIIQRDKQEDVLSECGLYPLQSLFRKLDAVFNAKKQLTQYGNFQLAIELMLLQSYQPGGSYEA